MPKITAPLLRFIPNLSKAARDSTLRMPGDDMERKFIRCTKCSLAVGAFGILIFSGDVLVMILRGHSVGLFVSESKQFQIGFKPCDYIIAAIDLIYHENMPKMP
jgi:hypothetical protein